MSYFDMVLFLALFSIDYSYTQEMPSRFKKDILSAAKKAAKKDETDRVALEGMQRVLANINIQDKISAQEMDMIFHEMGGECRMIPTDRLMMIL
jgi:hypothetical protein